MSNFKRIALTLTVMLTIPVFAKENVNLCYFSLNNEKEFVAMDKFVKKLGVDNITVKEYLTKGNDPEKSFLKMVESGTKCDGLVLSGHHTGAFGGKRSSGSLGIDFLEKLSCNPKYKDFFENIKALWLQGCRTLGEKVVPEDSEECTTADCHRDRVGAVLEEDHLEQSFAQLEMEFSATLDRDNPLSSRWLRVAPRATVFGWTRTAPGERAGSSLSVPYHIAHIARLTDDRKEFFDNPATDISPEAAAKYTNTILDVLGSPRFGLQHPCYREDVYIDAWYFHGQAKTVDGHYPPYSFDNPDLEALPSLISVADRRLARAKELDCLLKTNPSKKELDAILDEIFSDGTLLGYNFNSLHELLSKLQKDENTKKLKHLRKKLQSSKLLSKFLARKLNSKELGTLRKIDYYAFYRDMTGKTLPEVEDKIRQVSFKQFAMDIDPNDYNRRDYVETLLQSLIKHELIGIKDFDTMVEQAKSEVFLYHLTKAIPEIRDKISGSDRGKILEKIMLSPKANAHTLTSVAYAIGNSNKPIPGAGKMLEKILVHLIKKGYSLGGVAYAIGNSREPIPDAGKMLEKIMIYSNSVADLSAVANAVGISEEPIPNGDKILEKIMASPKTNGRVLSSVAYAFIFSKDTIPDVDKNLEKIMDHPRSDANALEGIIYNIGRSKETIPNADKIIEKILESPHAQNDDNVLREVAILLGDPKKNIPGTGRMLEKVISFPKADYLVLRAVGLAVKNSKKPLPNAANILEQIIDHPEVESGVLPRVRESIKKRVKLHDRARLLKKLDKVEERLRQ